MNEELLRTRAIELMSGFMKEVLYADQELTEEEAQQQAALYFDLVEATKAEVISNEEERIATQVARDKEANDLKAQGIFDASDASTVDLMGGPSFIDENTFFKG